MSIYKTCHNCIYSEIYSKVSNCNRLPEVVDINDREYEPCIYHELNYERINFELDKFNREVDVERRALKREIKRLGGNPRKLGK